MQIEPFFQIPQHTIQTSRGPVQLPLLFKEGDFSVFLFVVDKGKADSLMKGTGLRPAMTFGNRTFVALVLGHYSMCSLKPFRFAGLTISAEREFGFRPTSPWAELFSRADHRHMGFYSLHCPFDSAEMATVGREVWGFPNDLCDIGLAIEKSGVRAHVECAHTRKTLFEVNSFGLPLWRISAMDFTIFSVLDQQILRSLFNTRGHLRVSLPLSFRLRMGDSLHPLANSMRLLGLPQRRPFLCLTTNHFQGRIHEGSVVENLADAPPSPGTAAARDQDSAERIN